MQSHQQDEGQLSFPNQGPPVNSSTSRSLIQPSKLVTKRQYEEITENNSSNSDESFFTPNKKQTISASKINSKYVVDLTTVHNKFSPLEEMDDEIDNVAPASTQESTSTRPTPKIRVPPIFLHEVNNYQQIICDIDSIVSNEYSTQQQNKVLKINTTTAADFRLVTKFLEESQLPYHTFRNPDTKRLEVVLRNVPHSLTDNDVILELKSLNLPVIKVTRLFYRDRQPMPLCAVELDNNEQGKKIFYIKQIQHALIRVEYRRKPRNIPQCTRCQRYGHTKNFCHLTPRCVKCPQNHHFSECTKPKEAEPTCINCGGAHSANFKGCSYYLGLKKKSDSNPPQQNLSTSPPTLNLQNFPNLTANSPSASPSTPSWPHSVPIKTNVTNTSIQDTSPATDVIGNLIQLVITSLKPHLPVIKTFLLQLVTGLLNNEH